MLKIIREIEKIWTGSLRKYRCLMGKFPKLSDNFTVKFYFGKIITNIF